MSENHRIFGRIKKRTARNLHAFREKFRQSDQANEKVTRYIGVLVLDRAKIKFTIFFVRRFFFVGPNCCDVEQRNRPGFEEENLIETGFSVSATNMFGCWYTKKTVVCSLGDVRRRLVSRHELKF